MPDEAVFRENAERISLIEKRKWIERIQDPIEKFVFDIATRESGCDDIICAGFEINDATKQIIEIYK